MNQLIALVSGKGGVGKTTVAANLGLALHNMGEEAVVVDGDVKNPNLGLQLGMYEYHTTLQDITGDSKNALDALHIHSTGLRVIPSSLSFSKLDTQLPNLKALFSGIKGYMIIDSSPGITEDVLSVLRFCDDVTFVTNPELPAVADMMKILEVIKEMHKTVRGIVVNRVGRKRYELSLGEIGSICHLPVIGAVPEDEAVKKSISLKTPVVYSDPLSPAAQELIRIAHRVAHKPYSKPSFISVRRLLSRKSV